MGKLSSYNTVFVYGSSDFIDLHNSGVSNTRIAPSSLISQYLGFGTSGYAFYSNGTSGLWSGVFPNQSGNSGRILATNGSGVLWVASGTGGAGTIVGSDKTIIFNSGGSSYSGHTNFNWDYTNSRLGIGTGLPLSMLHLNPSSGTSGITINRAASQDSHALVIRGTGAETWGGIAADGSYLLQNTNLTTVVTDAYYVQKFKPNTLVATNYALVIDRANSNNYLNGVGVFLQDNSVYAGMRLWTNSFSQNNCDLEIISPLGIAARFPIGGGCFFYNSAANTTDISIVKIPTQTMTAGGGIPSPQGLFRLQPCPIQASSPNSLGESAEL